LTIGLKGRLSAQPDRIENIPARLDPDQAFDFLRANRFECQREYEGLRDGLYGERYVAIANFVNIASVVAMLMPKSFASAFVSSGM
jgi:hypothetical protein